MIASGIFGAIANAGYEVVLDPQGNINFKPRPDMTQNPSVIATYATWPLQAPSLLAQGVSRKTVDYLVTHVGRNCSTPMGPGLILSVDLVNSLVSVQHADANQTVRVWRPETISVAF